MDFIRTIEEILGLKPLNVSDALAKPMADVFDLNQCEWTYTATASGLLLGSGLPLPPSGSASVKLLKPTHDANYWAQMTKGLDFSAEDRVDAALYNHILWTGIMGDHIPYPTVRSGLDLRQNRKQLLAAYKKQQHIRKGKFAAEQSPVKGKVPRS